MTLRFPNSPPAMPYSWAVSASEPVGAPITFIGDPALMVTGTMALTWTLAQACADGSVPQLQYSTDQGVTWTTVTLGSEGTPQTAIVESGSLNIPLTGVTGLMVNIIATGGVANANLVPWIVWLSITRNNNEALRFDFPNPFNPKDFNGSYADLSGNPDTDTLLNLRKRMLVDLGFASQVNNPTTGVVAFCNSKLIGAQNFLYRRYAMLATRRFFRWKVIAGQRFYSLKDNDEDILSSYHMDPNKTIEWAGIQDTRNVWYPLIQGIPPQLYTMLTKPWRPARYDIRGCLEVYPAPDQTYFLWLRGHFGLLTFAADTDYTTIDSELVYLLALANAKAHYGQPDANNYASMANTYRGELIAGTHKTAHYVPGTIAVPPAVRPTLIQYQGNGTG